MFNKGENSNKFQIEAWIGENKASKSQKKLDKPLKLSIKDVERAVQIETTLRKCNSEILDKINKRKSVEKFDEQIDNLFEINKDKADLERTVKDMEDSELSLLSRMSSPNSDQKGSKLFGKKAMSIEAN
ncbi:hypothetical protein G9A89_022547 [Geosiphon pyriformis]|nr:hypothetical protein G9A89_022547 [Geosiphon pyriformis]